MLSKLGEIITDMIVRSLAYLLYPTRFVCWDSRSSPDSASTAIIEFQESSIFTQIADDDDDDDARHPSGDGGSTLQYYIRTRTVTSRNLSIILSPNNHQGGSVMAL
eukprot:scaffold91224_cov34-Attheya_sp.AAC.1